MEKVTREELYELVWTTPMSKLATRFGVSGVTLAKTCAKFNIPRPAQGYWQRLALGSATQKPQLPPSDLAGPVILTLDPAGPGKSQREPPPEGPKRHEAVRWVEASLASAKPDAYGRLVVAGAYFPAFCMRPAHVRRALRILDTLVEALVERGHEVAVAKRFDQRLPPAFLVRTQGGAFDLELHERLAERRRSPIPDGELKVRSDEVGSYFPNGELRLKLAQAPDKYDGQRSWSDTRARRLENILGRAVLAIEDAARVGQIEKEGDLRLAEQRETEERERARPKRLKWYAEWLNDDLGRMLDAWSRSRRIHDFLEEYERRLPLPERTEVSNRWTRGMRELADRLDPMTRITEIAKEIEPSDEVLARLVSDGRPS